MTRRELVKNTIGALVGISAIPAAMEKPAFRPCLPPSVQVPFRKTPWVCWSLHDKNGKVLKRTEYGDRPPDDFFKELADNFKANIHDCWAYPDTLS